ncbi:hypothetical protein RIF29_19349 [Crotalaria pallida]|uniref:Reverse transcriptase zinc-binding domain-containing protein n=1 Tax=Crotalaria pallida TaxID=3830 RepID=A0AAN9EZD0_CROPI
MTHCSGLTQGMAIIQSVFSSFWRATKGVLPVNKRLHDRGINVDPICPCCGAEVETISHALLQCVEVTRIWFASPLAVHIPIGDDINFDDWIFGMIEKGHKEGLMQARVQDLQHGLLDQNALVSIDAAHKIGIGTGMGLIVTTNDGTFLAAATGLQREIMDPSVAEVVHKARSNNSIADFLANLAFDIYDNVWLDAPYVLHSFFPPADAFAADE